MKQAGFLHTAGRMVGQCGCCPPSGGRRGFLAGGAALWVSAAVPGMALSAAAMAAGTGRSIDIHHHFEPTYKNVDGNSWSIQMALDQLDQNGIDTAIAYAGPITDTDVQAGRKKARQWNEWSTQFCVDNPGRFGLFASLPFNDVEGSLAEIAYALDVLKADGIGLTTQYQDAWLGDAKFEPIFQELNRRKAVVYVHPSQAPCCTPATLSYEKDPISAPWIEFPTNTARTIVSLWAAKTTLRLPDIKFIFCHGGGVTAALLGRMDGFSGWRGVGAEKMKAFFPNGVYAEYAKLYFDCAQAYAPEAWELLRKVIPPTHLLFGSDFSYFYIAHAVKQFAALDMPDALRRQVQGGNAAALFPRWQR